MSKSQIEARTMRTLSHLVNEFKHKWKVYGIERDTAKENVRTKYYNRYKGDSKRRKKKVVTITVHNASIRLYSKQTCGAMSNTIKDVVKLYLIPIGYRRYG